MNRIAFLLPLLLVCGFVLDTPVKPDDSRFTKVVLDNDLNEPMELAIADNGMVYYIERVGYLNSYDPTRNQKKRIAKLDVRFAAEDGLLGLALDPNFLTNHWLYLYYGDPTARENVYANVLARFELTSTGLANRVEMLRVPLIHEGVSHSGGSLTFDSKGNLYLSTGDNTNPFESDGYGPFDDRPGRLRFDALKSSGNTNDLRGKILRIHPEPDGSYTIPTGNLFPPGTDASDRPQTRPEIYVMGCRNPFRIAVDQRTGYLYWGEVGPDAGKDSSSRGPAGHDEINQARQAGNFGWPLFVANNKPYHAYDFDQKTSGIPFNPQKPVNLSRNNTGLKELPPAQPAFIWYPYTDSPKFPMLGNGGRNAMGGPVYYYDDYQSFAGKFPRYYDGKLFIYDWMRGWVFTVRMNQQGNLDALERFLPNMEFNHPVDMAFNRRGELYMLEYGSYWRAKNTDARLVRIEYTEGNRAPIAKISADRSVGAAPLTVQFSAKSSFDYDRGDSLRYEWFFTSNVVQSRISEPRFTFTRPGAYRARLRITDRQGKQAETQLPIQVGNEPPTVRIDWQGNRSFYVPGSQIAYNLKLIDREDKPTATDPAVGKRSRVALYHLPEGEDIAGLAATGEITPKGKTFMEQSDCRGCHALNQKSVGPSYLDIARRYDDKAVSTLASKIINGGGGVWTKDHVMAAHPQLLAEDAAEMVRYILSLTKPRPELPARGQVTLPQPQGKYILLARYQDKGGLVGQDLIRLYPTRFNAAEADRYDNVARRNGNGSSASAMNYNEPNAWICFKNVDLTGLKTLKASLQSPGLTGMLEVRADSPTGRLLGQFSVETNTAGPVATSLVPMAGMHDLYLVYREKVGGINIWKRLEVRELEVGF